MCLIRLLIRFYYFIPSIIDKGDKTIWQNVVVFLVLICSLTSFPTLAQYEPAYSFSKDNYQFEPFELPGGKLENTVNCIAQDTFGFLWFGTHNGLVKYDGHQFTRYLHLPTNTNSLANNYVDCIYIDKNGILWIGSFYGGITKFNPKTNQFKRYWIQDEKEQDLKGMGINTILGYNKYIWFGTLNGLHRFDPNQEKFKKYFFTPLDSLKITPKIETERDTVKNQKAAILYKIAPHIVRELYVDKTDTLWVGMGFTWDADQKKGGLYKYLSKKDNFITYRHSKNKEESLSDNRVKAIFEDSKNNFWIGTMGDGLHLMNRKNKRFNGFPFNESAPNQLSRPVVINPKPEDLFFNQVQVIHEDYDKNLWIGAINGGLNIYNPKIKEQIHFESGMNGLETSEIWDLFETADQTIFICTGGDGEGKNYKLKSRINPFHFYNTTKNSVVKTIVEIKLKKIWIGFSNEPGLWRFELDNYFTSTMASGTLATTYAFDFNKDHQLLVGHSNGLFQQLFLQSKNESIDTNLSVKNKLTTESLYAVKEDLSGNIWIASWGNGLFRWNPQTKNWQAFKHKEDALSSIGGNFVSQIYQDSKGNIWVGGGRESKNLYFPFFLDRFDETADTFIHYYNKELEFGYPSSITEDKEGQLWYPTILGGIHQLNPSSGKITRYNQSNSQIPTDEIRALVIAPDDNLWMSSEKSIIRFTPDRHSFIEYTEKEGIKVDYFEYGTGYISPDKTIFFGGAGGFHFFNSQEVIQEENLNIPKITITKFTLNRSSTDSEVFQEPENILGVSPKINLSHYENTFSIGFNCIDYNNPEKVYLEYKLENQSSEWQKANDKKIANYYNLPSGKYLFKVRGANSRGLWNTEGKQLEIIIHPAWWNTWWANLLFISFGIGLFYWFYKFQLKRKLALQKAEKIAELDQFKTRLYTNITHEFRTPLTIITGMAEQIKKQPDLWLENGVNMIQRNGQNLLNLINQLLDLQKLESKKLPINAIQGDVIIYVKYLTESFQSYAVTKKQQLHFLSKIDTLWMDYDSEKLSNILSNLISNAIKFSKEAGNIYLQLDLIQSKKEKPLLEIIVKDTGQGIADEKLPFIFDRFYQGDNKLTRQSAGTGIGLALSKELVQLMGGNIEVKSKIGIGTSFRVLLPITRNAPKQTKMSFTAPPLVKENAKSKLTIPSIPQEGINEEQPLVLIIEDNIDVQFYLRTCLKEQYGLIYAENGLVGIEKAMKQVPDIIISDVMMPEKDGLEVCDTLKKETTTSHIPIILLTAKAGLEDKIKGLRFGADAYLAKPFHPEELLVRLTQLIENRKRLQAKYSSGLIINTPAPKTEEVYLQKLQQAILENIDKIHFGPNELARAVGTSRAQLHRKIKALTNISTSNYINTIRLQEAKKLLKTTTLSISEIAYSVGFSTPQYFSNSFSKAFNCSPSEFRELY